MESSLQSLRIYRKQHVSRQATVARTMALTEEDPAAAPAEQEQEAVAAERAPVTGHVAMVDRVPLIPWGSASSGPSLPSADDEEVPDVSERQ